jgi:hypothetical protein
VELCLVSRPNLLSVYLRDLLVDLCVVVLLEPFYASAQVLSY